MTPHHFDLEDDPSASDSLSFLIPLPGWPYILGAIAGPAFGCNLLLFLAAARMRADAGEGLALLAVFGAALAGMLLGIAWFGVRRDGQGGAGPLAGSFAFPLAVAYLYFSRGSHGSDTAAALATGALAVFGWGHAAAPCNPVIRGLAVVGAVMWSLLFAAAVGRWDIPNTLVLLSIVELSLTSILLAFSFSKLRYVSPRRAPQRSRHC